MKIEQSSKKVLVRRVSNQRAAVVEHDALAIEEPLEIRVGFFEHGRQTHKSISITMRTPGATEQEDFELAAGFLFTENIVSSRQQIENIRHCGKQKQNNRRNTVRVDLKPEISIDFKRLERHFYTSSSCGVCGKSSIEALETGAQKLQTNDDFVFSASAIHCLPETLRLAQNVFERTGGLHAAALFDRAGNLEVVREDVGRHNAVDKLIGAQFLAGKIPLDNRLLLVSGRASFELVQKALMARVPVLAAVGAPSSLAVESAQTFGMTLLGFVRDERFNIYANAQRINAENAEVAAVETTSDAISRARKRLCNYEA